LDLGAHGVDELVETPNGAGECSCGGWMDVTDFLLVSVRDEAPADACALVRSEDDAVTD